MNRLERVGRGIVATSFAIMIAALSHVIAGAETPSALAILVTIVVVLPLSIALAGVRLSFLRLGLIVLASQGLFHVSFAMIGVTGDVAGASVHDAHSMGLVASSSADSLSTGYTVSMWIAHALAAAFTFAVLAFGERAAVSLLTIVVAALAALRAFSLTLSSTWPKLLVPIAVDVHPIAHRFTRAHSQRGPPAFFA